MSSTSSPQAQPLDDLKHSHSEAISASQKAPTPTPSADELDDLLLDCRFGELEGVTLFVKTYSTSALADARDERRNNVLHMCAANGHDDILAYILSLPQFPSSLLKSGNESGNTPLHWACVNAQLACAKLLVNFKPSSIASSAADSASSPPPKTIPLIKPQLSSNAASSQTDADLREELDDGLGPALIFARNSAGHTPLGEAENAGWEEGARWLVSVMDLQLDSEREGEVGQSEETGDVVDDHDDGEEVEVELARMKMTEEDFKKMDPSELL